MWLKDIVLGLVSPVTNYMGKRSDNKKAIAEQQIQRVMNAEDKAAEWENIQAEAGKHSWKDEYWTIILSVPAVMVFFPEYVDDIQAGFEVLANMPEFYQYWLGVAILTSFGLRIAKR